ncbi:MAG: DUF1993 domain-containing protein [Polyangiaceae bacterium]
MSTAGALAVGTFVPMLRTLRALLDKGAAKLDPEAMPALRLVDDMFPLTKQVVLACHWGLDCAARLRGEPPPVLEDVEEPLDASRARIERAVALLGAIDPSSLEGSDERVISVPLGPPGAPRFILEMPGARYVRDWSLPHFYFHVVTAYDILRAKGVAIGKQDYLAHAGDAIRPVAA